MRILCIAAHPDDEVLGCGGTLARFSREGHETYVAILGEGITSRHAKREAAGGAQLEALKAKAANAAKIMGVRELFTFGLPDNRFDTVPLLDVVKVIETLTAQLQPEIVFTQHGGDLNLDHVVTYRAALTATRPMAGCPVKHLFAYEVMSSTEWAFQKYEPAFRPSTFVDIGATLDTKIAAMQNYESEARPFPHPRSPESLRAAALHWGSVAGLQAAEAFELVRHIWD
ncbi:MAG TPA: PIG-L deacetylase family protein [Planctomycetota bacterium]|nr:PIG-L deacetylase family protein [Planctomycetota bacterium]